MGNNDMACVLVVFCFLDYGTSTQNIEKFKKRYIYKIAKLKGALNQKFPPEVSKQIGNALAIMFILYEDTRLQEFIQPILNVFKRFGYKAQISRFKFFEGMNPEKLGEQLNPSAKLSELSGYNAFPEKKTQPNISISVTYKEHAHEIKVVICFIDDEDNVHILNLQTSKIRRRIDFLKLKKLISRALLLVKDPDNMTKCELIIRNLEFLKKIYMLENNEIVRKFWKNPELERNKLLSEEPTTLSYLVTNKDFINGSKIPNDSSEFIKVDVSGPLIRNVPIYSFLLDENKIKISFSPSSRGIFKNYTQNAQYWVPGLTTPIETIKGNVNYKKCIFKREKPKDTNAIIIFKKFPDIFYKTEIEEETDILFFGNKPELESIVYQNKDFFSKVDTIYVFDDKGNHFIRNLNDLVQHGNTLT